MKPLPSVTAARKRAFLKILSEIPSIRGASRAVGLDHKQPYKWAEADPVFARKFENAKAAGVGKIEAEAMRRAAEGVERYVVQGGRVVMDPNDPKKPLTIREFSDNLMNTLLKAHGGPEYREKSSVELTGENGGPVKSVTMTLEEFKKTAKAIAEDI